MARTSHSSWRGLDPAHPRLTCCRVVKTWMAATSAAMTFKRTPGLSHRHARACRGHPRLYDPATSKDVDGRNKSGHDVETRTGLSHRHARLNAAHPRLYDLATSKDVDGRNKSGHDKLRSPAMTLKRTASHPSCPALCRASTSLRPCNKQDVDGRNKSGHDKLRSPAMTLKRIASHSSCPAMTRQANSPLNMTGSSLSPGRAEDSSLHDQLLNFTPVIASRLPCQIFSLSAFGMSMPSMMRSVSRVYIVPFSGSNGQSEANTILSRS